MAQYFTDFSEYTTGSIPPDWSAHLGAEVSVVEDASYPGGKGLSIESGGFGSSPLATWDGKGTSHVQVVVKIESGISNGNRAALRVDNTTDGSETFYAARDLGDGDSMQIMKYVNGSFSTVAAGSHSASGGPYFIRFECESTTLRAKLWEDGQTEPSSWQVTATDSDISGGDVGIHSTDSSDYSLYGVGTNGDEAPLSSGPSPPSAPSNLQLSEQ